MSANQDFETFYKSHYSFVYNLIKMMEPDRTLVEEIVQDTFHEASRNFQSLSTHPNIRGWLVTTAKYNLKDALKSKRRKSVVLLHDDSQFAASDSDFESILLQDQFLSVLNAEEVTLLMSYYKYGYTMSEIARKNGITPCACRVRIHRIRKKLKEQKNKMFT